MENNLLIGIIESEEQIEDQSSDWNSFKINKIGGYPVLSPNTTNHLIHCFNSLVCDLCRKSLTFVLQINCPIDDSLTDRLIYLFVCINSECNQNKWFAIRSVTTFVNKSDKKPENSHQNNEWIDGQTDWGTDCVDEDMNIETNICSDSLAKLSVNCNDFTTECKSIAIESMAYFRPFYVSVIEEPTDTVSEDKHIKQLIESYVKNNFNEKSGDNSSESFENNYIQTIYRNDRKNYEFYKTLSVFPKQIIRYQWLGTPLINSDNHNPITSKCEICGADRYFELQLMPALISYLKPLLNTNRSVNLDFGTVLIFTCAQNCVKNDSISFEETITLSDPDNELFDKINGIINKI